MSMDDARLDHFRLIVEAATGRHDGPEGDSYDLEALVDEGELTIRDVAWLIKQATKEPDIATGVVNWYIKPHAEGVMTFTMRSSVRPSTWLAMYVDRAGWEEIKAAGDKEMTVAEDPSASARKVEDDD